MAHGRRGGAGDGEDRVDPDDTGEPTQPIASSSWDDHDDGPPTEGAGQTGHTGQDEQPGRPRRRSRFGRVSGATGRGIRRAGTATGHGATYTLRQARKASRAEGAGESGLFRLIELHAFNAAGDAAVAIALAGTLFFAQPGEARGQVALFLGLTMLPFAVVAPLLGPFLDRFSHGRRWAIGATMALRAFLCWLMADAVASQSILLFPTALGVLVSSKAYGVARAATVPRLQPPGLTLVKANSRISLAGVVGAAIAGPIAGGASFIGPEWPLRVAFVIFTGATVLSILLPARADAHAGELPVSLTGNAKKFRVPPTVGFALRCNAGLRMLSGFLTMYMAFLLRQHPLPGWEDRTTLLMGLVIGAAGLGNTVGIGLGSLLRRVTPAVTVVVALLADVVAAVVAAVLYGLVAAVVLGLTAGVAQSMGKLSLDATIQSDVPERNRTSAFARSETMLQLSWVVGGFIGIALPLIPHLGLGVLAGLMIAWTAYVLVRRPAAPVTL
ncbi:MAG: major facilitator superfamily 1 [Marmoricola sp.]|nr:major facilitator superfamily 1 [Marmoricola sp.]